MTSLSGQESDIPLLQAGQRAERLVRPKRPQNPLVRGMIPLSAAMKLFKNPPLPAARAGLVKLQGESGSSQNFRRRSYVTGSAARFAPAHSLKLMFSKQGPRARSALSCKFPLNFFEFAADKSFDCLNSQLQSRAFAAADSPALQRRSPLCPLS